MTRKRFIRLLRGAQMTTFHVNVMTAIQRCDHTDYADIVNQIKGGLADCYTMHGTPLPKELRA